MTSREMSEDPHTIARGMIAKVPAGHGWEHSVIPHPVKYSADRPRTGAAPPLLGEHSREVLAEFASPAGLRYEGLIGPVQSWKPAATRKPRS